MTAIAQPDCLPRWRDLARLTDEELGRHDIAVVNLAVAVGLPGWEAMDPAYCLTSLDQWTEYVRAYTERALPNFHRSPADYDHSEAYFRALCLITALQREIGVRYNPDKIPPDVPFYTADSFVYGAIQGPGGTCATLPVVYASVGRRLGYPIKLVSTRAASGAGHMFARWDGGGERFNMEATAPGLTCPPDGDYRTGLYALTPEVERWGCYLRSKSPREELAVFVAERAHRWHAAGSHRRGVDGFAWALALAPDNVIHEDTLREHMNRWDRWTKAGMPPGFPSVMIGPPPRRLFPDTLPVEYERNILGLMAVENLLLDPDYGRVWEQMRRGEWRGRGPNTAVIDFWTDGSSVAEVRFNP